MDTLRRVKNLLAMDLDARLGAADNEAGGSLGVARDLLREVEAAIAAMRSELRLFEAGVERKHVRMVEKQAAVEGWRARAARFIEEGKEALARTAISRQKGVERELKAAEEQWWEVSREQELSRGMLKGLENLVQEIRRRKEALVLKDRRGRSTSDFIPLPPSGDVGVRDDIEAELRRLKQERGNK